MGRCPIEQPFIERKKMAGTKAGGLKAAATNKARHGEDFYKRIGEKSWKNPFREIGGFGSLKKGKDGLTGPERAKIVGRAGGKISRRGSASSTI